VNPPDSTDEPFGIVDWALLGRYFAGEASAQDEAAIERWLAADPSRQWLMAAVRDAWAAAAVPATTPADADRMWKAVRAKVAAATTRPTGRSHVVPRRWWQRAPAMSGWPVTWVIAAGIVCAMLWWGKTRSSAYDTPVAGGPVYAARAGERAVVQLPDGTKFTLAPASRVTLSAAYAKGDRSVILDGEAYFSVTHDPRRPFTVHAGSAVVRDIGTRFDVRAYPTDSAVAVVVSYGRVALSSRRSPAAILATGVLGVVAPNGLPTTRLVDTSDYVAWARGELRFHDTPLGTVAADLSRWYGVEVRVDDPSLAGRRLTASVGDESIDHTLDLLVPTVGARYDHQGAAIVIARAALTPR
jgi:transmembrane sensor